MLLTNGRIYTMAARAPIVDSLLVRDGSIVFAGRRDEIGVAAGEPVHDLDGHAVVPGLVDAHAHLALFAKLRLELDLSQAASEGAVARLVAEAVRRTPAGQWITGRGWDETRWPERRRPTKTTLDRVAPGHPVALVRVDGHATWASSRALGLARIDRHTADPAGGVVVKDRDGEPSGVLIDAAQELVRGVTPSPSDDRLDAAVRAAIADCVARGLTGVHEMGADLAALASYRRLIERGQFPFRNYAAVSGKKAWAHYRERGTETVADGRLVVRALKLWLDGALGSRGAALHAPYADDPGNTGLLLLPSDELERWSLDAAARGFQTCVHAIGDRANTCVLDVFEQVLRRLPADRPRLRVEHAQVLAPSDVPRFARLGVLPSMQPTHATSDMRWAAERLGPDRLAGAYAWRSVLATGTIIAGGSDFPVEDPNPFLGIHAAVTRRPADGAGAPWQPHQRMTRDEAVRAFTIWNAIASGQEVDLGSLEPGKRADLVVLSEDVFRCPEDHIVAIVPELTMVAGEIVFRR